MNSWMIRKKINDTLLPEKEDFYSYLNIEDITDFDYTHTKRVYSKQIILKKSQYLKIKNKEEYHDLQVQSVTLLLADAFEYCYNMCLEIYEFDPTCFLTARFA